MREGLGELRQRTAPGLGQDQAAGEAAEQGDAEIGLELADLLADRGRGHRELVGSLGEALVAGGGLEGAQGTQGRQAAAHDAARARRKARSGALRVSRRGAHGTRPRASAVRPSRASRSPRTACSRW